MKLKNEDGFSLVQMIITLGLMGVITMGVVTTIQNTSRSQNYFNKGIEVENYTQEVSNLVTNRTSCTETFKNSPPINIGDEVPIGSIKDESGSDIFVPPQVLSDKTSAKVTVVGFSIHRKTDTEARLLIRMDRGEKRNSYVGARYYQTQIPLILQFDTANQVTSCYYDSSGNVEKACEQVNGIFDKVSGKCVLFDLVFGQHSSKQCQNIGGTVLTEAGTGEKFCKLSAATYEQNKSGWTIYKNWSETSPQTSETIVCKEAYTTGGYAYHKSWDLSSPESAKYMEEALKAYQESGYRPEMVKSEGELVPAELSTPCTTGSHSWGDIPIETCKPGGCGDELPAKVLYYGAF